MHDNDAKRRFEAPASLVKTKSAPKGEGCPQELGCFPPPPDKDELKRLLAENRSPKATMRSIGWITS